MIANISIKHESHAVDSMTVACAVGIALVLNTRKVASTVIQKGKVSV